MQDATDNTIYEVRTFSNSKGMTVTGLHPYNGLLVIDGLENSKTKYIGSAMISMAGQMMPINFEFPDGFSLQECFEKFEELATKATDEQLKKIQEDQFKQSLTNPNGFKLH